MKNEQNELGGHSKTVAKDEGKGLLVARNDDSITPHTHLYKRDKVSLREVVLAFGS